MSETYYDSNEKPCLVCGRSIRDILRHLRIRHDIENIEQMTRQINQIERKSKRQKEFAEYVEKLKKRIQRRDLTYEEYRRLVTQWTRENGHE